MELTNVVLNSNSLLTLLVDFLLLKAFPRVQLSTVLSHLWHHKVALPPNNTTRKIEESYLLRSDNLGVISFSWCNTTRASFSEHLGFHSCWNKLQAHLPRKGFKKLRKKRWTFKNGLYFPVTLTLNFLIATRSFKILMSRIASFWAVFNLPEKHSIHMGHI